MAGSNQHKSLLSLSLGYPPSIPCRWRGRRWPPARPSPTHLPPYSRAHSFPSPHPAHSPSTATCTLRYLTHLLHPEWSHLGHFSPSTKLASTPDFFPQAQQTQRSSRSLSNGRSVRTWPESENMLLIGLLAARRAGAGSGGDEGEWGGRGRRRGDVGGV